MQSFLPVERQHLLPSWNKYFSSDFNESLSVFIHGVALRFHFNSHDLLVELKMFFPREWQQDIQNAIDIYWISPEANKLDSSRWDDIADPNCIFFENFISQRDFLAKKITPRQFQLITPYKIDDGFFNFLRYLIPTELLQEKKILFHSSCVVNEAGKAFLFFGPSGAGKTTIASLCQTQGGKVLGDDMNLVYVKEGQLCVEAATVGQRYFSKTHFGRVYPVKKAFWIQQSKSFSIEKSVENSLSTYLSSFANLFWKDLEQDQFNQLFETLNNFRKAQPIEVLHFPKSNEVWNYVQNS